MNERRFFVCRHCGNLVGVIRDSGVPMICCGEAMSELVANTVDASFEKHLPHVERKGTFLEVTVGEVEHPMAEEHYIEWVYLLTSRGGERRTLKPGEPPKVNFCVKNTEPVAVYAYCNLHGLWKTEL